METKNKLYLILALILVFLSVLNFVIYYSNQPLEVEEVEASLKIMNRTGFDLNTTSLKFGYLEPGTSLERKFKISNQYGFPINVYFESEGNISRFLSFPKNISLRPGETRGVGVKTRAAMNESVGLEYKGKIRWRVWPDK